MLTESTAYAGNEPFIFISYAHADAGVVLPLVAGLKERGFRVWYDEGISDGEEWQNKIAIKMAASYCAILFISHAALLSPNCRREIFYAMNLSDRKKNRPAPIPVYLDDGELDPEMELILLRYQSRYFYKYASAEAFLDSLKTAAALQPCRQPEEETWDTIDFAGESTSSVQSPVEWYREAAEKGDPAAQFFLGYCYENGDGTAANLEIALYWYRMAAANANPEALEAIARCEKKQREAIARREKEQRRGSRTPEQCARDGDKLYQLKQYSLAVELLEYAADAGIPEAQCRLGDCCYYGHGIRRSEPVASKQKAMDLYRKAADQGLAEAQYRMWQHLPYDEDTLEGFDEAFSWCRKAAEQDYLPAVKNMAELYDDGHLLEADPAKAFCWWLKGAQLGDEDCQHSVARAYFFGEGVARNYTEAYRWARKPATVEGTTLGILAECLVQGIGGAPRNPKKALELFHIAAEDYYESMGYCGMGKCYYYGWGVARYYPTAVYWFSQAKDKYGDFYLALCNYHGHGLTQNREEAEKLLQKVTKSHHTGPEYLFGLCYEQGIVVDKDLKAALAWYQSAPRWGHPEVSEAVVRVKRALGQA